MINLHSALENLEPALLPIIAQRWNVDVRALSTPDMVKTLSKAMLEPERAARVWGSLDDKQRGAIQALNSAKGKMVKALFDRMFGEVRKMGSARIEREKPHVNPASAAEALYYAGLLAEGFEQSGGTTRPVVYVPADLLAVLPLHQTTYSDLEDDDSSFGETDEKPSVQPLEQAANPRPADTTIVDDLTTLLAYLQLQHAGLESTPARLTLAEADRAALLPHLQHRDPARLAFLLAIGLAADLIEVHNGRAAPRRVEARKWLSMKRAEQLRDLVNAWRDSQVYRELWWVPGLKPESPDVGSNDTFDPALSRKAVLDMLADLPPRGTWWSIEEFISAVKEVNADFQRTDYESWYIRNEYDEFLRGFESWDAIEGALLEFYLSAPMHWLGLVDLADDAARLTAYGRAFVTDSAWPQPQEQEDRVLVESDGTLRISRRVPRIDRFQAARFTSWGPIGEGGIYVYKVDAEGLRRAADQSVEVGRISDFLLQAMGKGATLPASVARLLESAARSSSVSTSHAATVERVLVLRTTSPEIADFLMDTPALRRFLGARLGPMAIIVRTADLDALRGALGEKGIALDLIGE